MIYLTVPKSVRSVADRVKDLCENFRYTALCSLICFFLFNCKSLSDAARKMPFSGSVSSMANAAKLFPFNRFRRRLLKSILRKYGGVIDPKDFAFVIDDTDNPKSGKLIFQGGRWGSSKGIYIGQKVMLLALVNLKTHIAIPIAYEILPKRQSKDEPTAIDHVSSLVKTALDAGYPRLTVVADSWFDSVKLMSQLCTLGCHYICEIKSNRKVKANPSPNVSWISLPDLFSELPRTRVITKWDSKAIQQRKKAGKVIAEAFVQLNNRKTPVKVIAVYNRRNSVAPFAYYASTDRSISRARIWMLSRARWSIEFIFRTTKQWLSFGRLSCSGENAAHLAVAMPFYLYSLLRLEPPSFWGLNELESPDRMLAKIQEKGLEKTFDILLSNQNHPRLNSLRRRRCMENVNRKPCCKPAGELMVG